MGSLACCVSTRGAGSGVVRRDSPCKVRLGAHWLGLVLPVFLVPLHEALLSPGPCKTPTQGHGMSAARAQPCSVSISLLRRIGDDAWISQCVRLSVPSFALLTCEDGVVTSNVLAKQATEQESHFLLLKIISPLYFLCLYLYILQSACLFLQKSF